MNIYMLKKEIKYLLKNTQTVDKVLGFLPRIFLY